MFAAIIVIRILFIACMVFVIGYIFGNFSKTKTLSVISKIAAITAIVLFIAANGILMRSSGWHRINNHHQHTCYEWSKDSVEVK